MSPSHANSNEWAPILGRTGEDDQHQPLYQHRQNPYSWKAIWGTVIFQKSVFCIFMNVEMPMAPKPIILEFGPTKLFQNNEKISNHLKILFGEISESHKPKMSGKDARRIILEIRPMNYCKS